jgi:hypothetical protein
MDGTRGVKQTTYAGLVRPTCMKRWHLGVVVLMACNHEARPGVVDGAGVGAGVSDGGGVGDGSGGGPGDAGKTLSVTITDVGLGRFEIANAGAASVSLSVHASIERKSASGTFEAIESRFDVGKGYRLVEQCRSTDDAPCVDVAAGATLVPVRWSGFNCSAQCNGTCRANSFEGPGTFRLVVSACDGSGKIAGPTFELPDNPGEMERWSVTDDVTSATIMRLELPSRAGIDIASAPAPDRVAGFAVRTGSEHALDRAGVDRLVALMRAPHGFDDVIAKRCAVQHLVGARVTRTLHTTGSLPRTVTAEIALDFLCQKVFTADGDGKHRVTSGSHFDPSRADFLAWVKVGLPTDDEIQKLK